MSEIYIKIPKKLLEDRIAELGDTRNDGITTAVKTELQSILNEGEEIKDNEVIFK